MKYISSPGYYALRASTHFTGFSVLKTVFVAYLDGIRSIYR